MKTRPATPEDIIEGSTIYILGDDGELHKMIIDEVHKPSDAWKGFCADDGSRYGLDNSFVEDTPGGPEFNVLASGYIHNCELRTALIARVKRLIADARSIREHLAITMKGMDSAEIVTQEFDGYGFTLRRLDGKNKLSVKLPERNGEQEE